MKAREVPAAEQWSDEMVKVEVSEGQLCLRVGFGDSSVVLKKVASEDDDAVIQLHQEADALRKLMAGALQSYASETRAQNADKPSPQTAAALAASAPTKLDKSILAKGRATARGLVGLPCPSCGSLYDSDLESCPFCRKRANGKSEPATANAALVLAPRPEPQLVGGNGNSNSSHDVMRACIDELLQAASRYASKLALAEGALSITADEAGKVMYHSVFPEESVSEPWECCSENFRHGYAIRAAALMKELRRRAGLNGNGHHTILDRLLDRLASEDPDPKAVCM